MINTLWPGWLRQDSITQVTTNTVDRIPEYSSQSLLQQSLLTFGDVEGEHCFRITCYCRWIIDEAEGPESSVGFPSLENKTNTVSPSYRTRLHLVTVAVYSCVFTTHNASQ